MVAPIRSAGPEDRSSQIPRKRGPYSASSARFTGGDSRPSRFLAENIRGYRILRGMTQDQMAARMVMLGHGWGRSFVSAIEGRRRGVTIDELFGLAITLGVSVGRLLDPSGPDRSRDEGLDVGLGHGGHSRPLPTELGRLLAASRAVIRIVNAATGTIDIDMVSDAASGTAAGAV
jgi:transcriptional regulator with XRE-family HTH domain